jgi:hypothetical protein
MKRSRIATLVSAIIMATAAIIGVASAGTAKAASIPYTYLCVDTNAGSLTSAPAFYCAYSEGSGYTIKLLPETTSSMTNWEYPPSNTYEASSYYGQIGQAPNDTPCMQVNASGGYTVREATCDGDAAETWNVVPISSADSVDGSQSGYVFQSQYNGNCLTDESGELKDGGCSSLTTPDWEQEFFPE